jgi:hypothetical protein
MTGLVVEIVRFVDPHQPGVVECSMSDAWDRQHAFIDKVPIFTTEDLTETSSYPRRGVIGCDLLRRWLAPEGREIATIDTNNPSHVESTEGQTQFDVRLNAPSNKRLDRTAGSVFLNSDDTSRDRTVLASRNQRRSRGVNVTLSVRQSLTALESGKAAKARASLESRRAERRRFTGSLLMSAHRIQAP